MRQIENSSQMCLQVYVYMNTHRILLNENTKCNMYIYIYAQTKLPVLANNNDDDNFYANCDLLLHTHE